MKPVLFGPAERALYGVLHEATGALQPLGVVSCHPSPYQYMRLRWIHRDLGDRLAQAGHTSLRFDWSGSGDSSRSLREVSVSTWIDDLRIAVAELRETSGVAKVAVFGQGLAGGLAALATSRGLEVDHLVLVDPVVRGQDHLRWLIMNDHLPFNEGPEELLGQPLPGALARELAAIDLSTAVIRCSGKVLVLETKKTRAVAAWLGHLAGAGCEVAHRVVPAAADPTPGALDEVLVATELPREVVRFISEVIA